MVDFLLGFMSGIGSVVVGAWGMGLYLKRHPEIMVRRLTRGMINASHDSRS